MPRICRVNTASEIVPHVVLGGEHITILMLRQGRHYFLLITELLLSSIFGSMDSVMIDSRYLHSSSQRLSIEVWICSVQRIGLFPKGPSIT